MHDINVAYICFPSRVKRFFWDFNHSLTTQPAEKNRSLMKTKVVRKLIKLRLDYAITRLRKITSYLITQFNSALLCRVWFNIKIFWFSSKKYFKIAEISEVRRSSNANFEIISEKNCLHWLLQINCILEYVFNKIPKMMRNYWKENLKNVWDARR